MFNAVPSFPKQTDSGETSTSQTGSNVCTQGGRNRVQTAQLQAEPFFR